MGEWVIPLPTLKKGKMRAASELYYVSEGVLLVLSKYGKGMGMMATMCLISAC